MPEDLEDKLEDFSLMLEGILCDECGKAATRVLSYWYTLKDEIAKLEGVCTK